MLLLRPAASTFGAYEAALAPERSQESVRGMHDRPLLNHVFDGAWTDLHKHGALKVTQCSDRLEHATPTVPIPGRRLARARPGAAAAPPRREQGVLAPPRAPRRRLRRPRRRRSAGGGARPPPRLAQRPMPALRTARIEDPPTRARADGRGGSARVGRDELTGRVDPAGRTRSRAVRLRGTGASAPARTRASGRRARSKRAHSAKMSRPAAGATGKFVGPADHERGTAPRFVSGAAASMEAADRPDVIGGRRDVVAARRAHQALELVR